MRGMTQEELAARVFTTRQTISNYETGKSKPDYDMIGKIAAVLEVDAESLLYGTGDRRKTKVWCLSAGAAFLFLLARSLRYSPLIMGLGTPAFLTYAQGYIMVVVPAVCCFMGWSCVRLHELYIRKHELHAGRPKALLLLSVTFFAIWFFSAFLNLPQIYEASSDPIKNQYGGPAKLSVYLETFYYKYIFLTMEHLPVLNSVFVLLGGIFAVGLNGQDRRE